ncbi:hypothetical protein Vadar_005279 [Vaccinium darrowii]|uniref:Uncharacterized protein n=1 Tax=Vaccinium darrowii TaxID=229202 RepID=A0ACB7YTH2_9ERIC|nr:hypothetical protein Vadar_005279 [Vaccinium darrowii]
MIATPPQPSELPKTINLWELMEELEDVDPVRNSAHHVRSFTFDVALNSFRFPDLSPTDLVPKSKASVWLDLANFEMNSNSYSNSASVISYFDPDVIPTKIELF